MSIKNWSAAWKFLRGKRLERAGRPLSGPIRRLARNVQEEGGARSAGGRCS